MVLSPGSGPLFCSVAWPGPLPVLRQGPSVLEEEAAHAARRPKAARPGRSSQKAGSQSTDTTRTGRGGRPGQAGRCVARGAGRGAGDFLATISARRACRGAGRVPGKIEVGAVASDFSL